MSKEKSFLVVSVGGPDNDGHLFWECPHPSFVHIRESMSSFVIFCFVTRVPGLGVFFGMVGYLLLLVLVGLLLGLPRLMILLVLGWKGCWVLILRECV